MADRTRFELREGDLPTTWFNIMPDLVKVAQPLPPLHPGTMEPLTADALAPLFPEALIEQEMSMDRLVEIPGPVLDVYRLWRPTPLFRATRLERALGTPARIFFKYEGVSPAGSHKPNTAVAQAYYNKEAGARRVVTETGAGQWGSALAMAANFFDLECLVYMVRASYDQKPYRRIFMEAFRGTVHSSPSDTTDAGRAVLAQHPDSTGSLGIAISEAVEVAAKSADTNYSLGSLLNHVLLHQSVIGQEAKKQMALAEATPDVIIGCVGGGSNFGGIAYPFLADKLRGESQTRFIAVEPAACPTLTKGRFAYDFGDTAKMTPLLPMYTLGHEFVPAPVHAGGLRYHGDSPSLSLLVKEGFVEARAYPQNPVFAAAMQFAQTQGIVSAPEPAHAIRAAIDVALEARETGQETTILFNLCGHGHFDMTAYDDYLNGRLPEIEFDDQDLSASLADMPEVPIG